MKNIDDNKIYFAKLNPNAIIPSKKQEDAGYDIYACFESDYFVIEPFKTRPVPTGIASAFSSKYYAQVEERSSMGKLGIKKSSGVFDSGYRGEYFILTYNTNDKPLIISKLDADDISDEIVINSKKYNKNDVIIYPYKKAICQLVLHILPNLEVEEISHEQLLSIKSERGENGFGSSGK